MAAAGFDLERAGVLGEVPHGFAGHGGGAHQFGYSGEGDPAQIAASRREVAGAILDGGTLVAPHQVHSPDVTTVTEPWADTPEGRPVADALVSATPGLVLGIVTADCAPVLFADIGAGVIGAAHAGWRGAYGGVLENTIDAMEALGARRENIAAAIGPTIAQASYEVDDGFRDQFDSADHPFFVPGREGHWQFDLPAYVDAQLRRSGVERIEDCALDTYDLSERYFSYRRATHEGAPNYGRQISLIALG